MKGVILLLVVALASLVSSYPYEELSLENIEERAIRLPGLADIVDHFREYCEKTLDKITGLTKEQRKELVQEFMDELRNFPNAGGWQTLKPSQIGQYLKELKEYAQRVVTSIKEKAKEMIEENKAGNTESKRAIAVPQFIKDLQDRIVGAFQKAIYTVTGLTEEQQEALVEEFKEGISQFPLPPIDRPWTFFNPLNWVTYIKDLTKYNIALTKNLLEKAKNLVTGKPIVTVDERDIEFPEASNGNDVLNFEKVLDYIKNYAAKAGLTVDEQNYLIAQVTYRLNQYPRKLTGLAATDPLKWAQYNYVKDEVTKALKDVDEYIRKKNGA